MVMGAGVRRRGEGFLSLHPHHQYHHQHHHPHHQQQWSQSHLGLAALIRLLPHHSMRR